MQRLYIDSAGRVLCLADASAGIVPPDDGSTIDVDNTVRDQIGQAEKAGQASNLPFDLHWDGKRVVAKARAKSMTELDDDDRRDIATKIAEVLANWDTLTAAQKDRLLRLCARGVLRLSR